MTSAEGASLRISDQEFLEDYLTFALWQPAYMAHWLYTQAASATTAKACFGLQMYLNLEMALEALSKWYFALRDWKPGAEPLLWRYKKTEVRENPEAEDYATHVALRQLESLCVEQALSALKQPSEADLAGRGWSGQELKDRSDSVGSLLKTLRAGLHNRAAGGGHLVGAFNNLKHGLLVLHQLPGLNDRSSAFLIATVKKAQGHESLITPLGLSAEPESLDPLRSTTIATCKLVAALLALIPWYHYSGLTWQEYKAQPGNLIGSVAAISQKIQEMVASP